MIINMIRNSEIKQNKFLYFTAICLFVYAILELGDCITITLISLNLVPNIYINFVFEEIGTLMQDKPYVFIPFFVAFTSMRFISALGLFKNREWGYWIALYSTLLTMILTILFLPIGSYELFMCAGLLCTLIIGKFGRRKILAETPEHHS
jgi:hypothetical protein